jgi:hypothetical protein
MQVIAVVQVQRLQLSKLLPVAEVAVLVPVLAVLLLAVVLLVQTERSLAVPVAVLRSPTSSELSWFQHKSPKSEPFRRPFTTPKNVSVATT